MNKYKIFLDSACVTCKPNSILGSRVYQYLLKNDHHIENSLKESDYIIINTCGFNDFHENLSKDIFHKYSKHKKQSAKVISIGCLNKINENLIKTSWPDTMMISDLNELDHIFYNKVRFSDLSEACLSEKRLQNLWESSDRCYDFFDKVYLMIGKVFYRLTKSKPALHLKIKQVLDEAYKKDKFFVEISQGCLSQCSYCVIKKAKGKLRSRSIQNILKDIERLYQPHKNLCLIADDCGSYGFDRKESLFSLLYAINKKYPQLGIDISYINPVWIEKHPLEYFDLFEKVKINSVNISMQSGSDKIIHLMNRKYSVDKVLSVIKELKRISPRTLYWTHIIIGFPTETHADFLKTMSLLDHFDLLSKFLYSDRSGTPSVEFKPKIGKGIIFLRKTLLRIKEIKVYTHKVYTSS